MIWMTAAVPEAMRDDANALAMVLGQSLADGNTYRAPGWQDAEGNLYCVTSTLVGLAFVAGAQSALRRPAWDAENEVNMAGAGRAQAALRLAVVGFDPETGDPLPVPVANPENLTAVIGAAAAHAIELLGLSRSPSEEPL